MRKLSILFFSGIILTLVFITSCGTKFPKEIARLDSLQVVLNKSEIDFKTIDSVKISQAYKESKDNLIFLQKNLTDTLTKDMAEFLDEYSSVYKTFEHVQEQYSELSKELKYSKEQLKNMKHDLEYNILKSEQVKEYGEREAEAVKRNQESVYAMCETVKDKMEVFEKNNPQVIQMVEQTKVKKRGIN